MKKDDFLKKNEELCRQKRIINKLLTIILLHKKVVTTPATIVNNKYIKYFLKYSITDLLNTLLYTNLGCNQKGIANVLIVVPKNIPTNP